MKVATTRKVKSMSQDISSLLSIITALKVFFGDSLVRRAKVHKFLTACGLMAGPGTDKVKFQKLIWQAENMGLIEFVKNGKRETYIKFI